MSAGEEDEIKEGEKDFIFLKVASAGRLAGDVCHWKVVMRTLLENPL